MARPLARLSLTRSTLIASGFVLSAAAVTWFGLDGLQSPDAEPALLVTVAGDSRPPREEAPIAGISMGGLPTRIVVPAAGVDTSVSEVGVTFAAGKAAYETAWRAAGHHLDSALPGQAGNMVITGHVSVADGDNVAVFSRLDAVRAGDIVEVYSGDQAFRYEVSKVIVVPPNAVKLLRSDSTATVTLVTCTKDLQNRLVVIGTLTA